jgi:hypothetical protein
MRTRAHRWRASTRACQPKTGTECALIEKRDDETITAEEWRELAALTDRLELLHADRLAALAELAKLRGITLDEVMSQLGIQFSDRD